MFSSFYIKDCMDFFNKTCFVLYFDQLTNIQS